MSWKAQFVHFPDQRDTTTLILILWSSYGGKQEGTFAFFFQTPRNSLQFMFKWEKVDSVKLVHAGTEVICSETLSHICNSWNESLKSNKNTWEYESRPEGEFVCMQVSLISPSWAPNVFRIRKKLCV